MNKVEVIDQADTRSERATTLKPFLRLEIGALITLLMPGHSRSPVAGQEYYAPAVVLAQYNDDYGSIDALVWDSSAGNHYAHGYHIREVGVRGEGSEREMYELQSNVGQVLFSPDEFSLMGLSLRSLQEQIRVLQIQVTQLQSKAGGGLQGATEDKSQQAKPAGKSSSGA